MSMEPPAYTPVAAPQLLNTNVSSGRINFTLNGQAYSVDPTQDPIHVGMSLAQFIRGTKWTGTKISCHEGGCGVCTVALTYTDLTTNETVTRAAHSCLRPLLACDGMTITTNDGLGNSRAGYHPIQQRLAAANGSQCGFCSNGFVMTMYSLLAKNPNPTALEIEREFDGNLCRCTGYRPILDAMKTFAKTSEEKDEDGCREHGCKRHGLFPDMEELPNIMHEDHPEYSHTHPTAKHKTTVGATPGTFVNKNGKIWQTCHNVDSLNFWLSWYASIGANVMLVVGQTSLGVFPRDTASVKLFIGDIPELRQISQDSTGITIGAAATISNVIDYFTNCSVTPAYKGAHLPQAVKHLERVASVMVRNVGSVVGNMMMVHNNQGTTGEGVFQSDVAVVFYGLGVQLSVMNPTTGNSVTLNFADFLAYDMTGQYVQSVWIPWARQNEFYMSYKMAIRQVNSHALINAAMRAVVNPTTNTIASQPTVVFGGLWSVPTRVTAVETAMVGLNVTSQTSFQTALTALNSYITANPPANLPRTVYRVSLVSSYFYKYFLFLQGASLAPSLQRASECWLTRPVTTASQAFQTDPAEYPVSIGMPKLDSIQQTSGAAVYTEDIPSTPDTVYASIVQATQGNCSFTVDTTVASKMPGFIQFISASDIPAAQNAWQNGPVFASGTVSYAGQCIGVVVATTFDYAWQAADAVSISYSNVQPNITTIEQAVAANSYFPPTNGPAPVTCGDVQTAIKTAQNVVTDSVTVGYQYHFHMENQSSFVIPRENGYDVHCATQAPVMLQQAIAAVLGVNSSTIVLSTKRSGGGFGGKITNSILPTVVCAVAASIVGLPVKHVLDMQKCMRGLGPRGGKIMNYTVAFNNDGTITGLESNVVCAAGVQEFDCIGDATVTLHNLDNCYKIPNFSASAQLAQMNIPAVSPVRGPGWVPAVHLMETVISRVARHLGMAPEAVRTKNFYQRGDTTVDGMLLRYWNIQTIWEQLQTSASYQARVADVATFNTNNQFVKRGLSLVPVRFGVPLAGGNFDSLINIYPDGTIGASHGGCEIGQGINTKVTQTIAMKFGLTQAELPLITINETSTRTISGASNVTGGSVTSELCSLSIMHACDTLNRRLAPFRAKGQTWQQLIGTASGAGVQLTATGWSMPPPGAPPSIFTYNSTSAAMTEVEVDTLTGQFEVKRVDILFDSGISMNPVIDIGQVEGGYMFGMGLYTSEYLEWDPNTGMPKTNGTWEYKPPCAYDVPEIFNITLLKNSRNPLGVLSSKACGEPGVCLGTGIVHALEDAITAARLANGTDTKRWCCSKTPLLVSDIQQACNNQQKNYTL